MSKGSRQRPAAISQAELAENWELVFGEQPTPDIGELHVLAGDSYTVLTRTFAPGCQAD